MAENVIKRGNFVELEYTGWTEDGFIFDTTDEKVAKDNQLFLEGIEYTPVIVCVGRNNLIPGLDKALEGKEVGKEYNIELNPEDAFGKRLPEAIKLVSLAQFRKHKLNPSQGMEIEIDGKRGVVKSVSGGRVLVDMNHPLAGKKLTYKFKVNRIVENEEEKVNAIIKRMIGISEIKAEVNDKTATIKHNFELPQEVMDLIKKEITESCNIEEVIFKKEETKKEKEEKDETKRTSEDQ
ncbi:MAG: hypothetical protein PWQ87_749 [Candidatus Woesearchaeota archaeon]|nr:hypothetical protein [Candidatus Woesearchaeota archaeon]